MNYPNLPPAVAAAFCNLMHAIMTSQPIAAEDRPDVGQDTVTVIEDDNQPEVIDAALAFSNAAPAPAPAPAPLPDPIITPTAKLQWPLAEMYAAGHTNESLAADGYITIVQPAAPVPAPAPAPSPNAAPSPTQSGTQPAAGSGASTGGANTAAMLDSGGVPWDERIHSGSREMTTAGVWKKRKNVQPGVYAQITEELRIKHLVPFTPLNAGAPAAPPPPVATSAPAPAPAPSAAPAPSPAPAPSAAPSPDPYPLTLVGVEKPFTELCKYVTAPANNFSANNGIARVCEQFGVTGLGNLAPSPPEVLEAVYQAFRALRA